MKDYSWSKRGGMIMGSYSLLAFFFHFEVGEGGFIFVFVFHTISLFVIVKFLCYCLSNCDLFE